MKLAVEVAGLLAAGLLVLRVSRRHSGGGFAGGTLLAVAAIAAVLASTGVVVSGERGVSAYHDGAALSARGRLVPAASQVTLRLRRLGYGPALLTSDGIPRWIAFAEWLRGRLPPDAAFAIASPAGAERTQFRAWLDWRLFPRVQVATSDHVRWIVFFDRRPQGALAGSDRSFAPGFSLVRRPAGA